MNKKKYYHYTRLENLQGIMNTKTLNAQGGVYVCDSFEDLSEFIKVYAQAKYFNLKDIVGIEFTTDAEFEESFDHNPNFIKARAFVCDKEVLINIINIFNIA